MIFCIVVGVLLTSGIVQVGGVGTTLVIVYASDSGRLGFVALVAKTVSRLTTRVKSNLSSASGIEAGLTVLEECGDWHRRSALDAAQFQLLLKQDLDDQCTGDESNEQSADQQGDQLVPHVWFLSTRRTIGGPAALGRRHQVKGPAVD
jgi:hypothetical protein